MNNELRQKVKIIKALNNISYKEIATKLNINANSFYNWIKGQYDLSEEKQRKLYYIIENLQR